MLEAAVDDVLLDTASGQFHVAGVPAVGVGWAEVAARSEDTLVGVSDFTAEGPTLPFGAHLAVVEVDTETGAARLVRMVAVDDAGTLINPLISPAIAQVASASGAAVQNDHPWPAISTPSTAEPKASIEPTDRSMPPTTNTNVMPTATNVRSGI